MDTTTAATSRTPSPACLTQLNPAELQTPEQVATALGLAARTLATWRSTGRHGLPYIRCGGRIRYRRSDVTAWLEQRQHSGEGKP